MSMTDSEYHVMMNIEARVTRLENVVTAYVDDAERIPIPATDDKDTAFLKSEIAERTQKIHSLHQQIESLQAQIETQIKEHSKRATAHTRELEILKNVIFSLTNERNEARQMLMERHGMDVDVQLS